MSLLGKLLETKIRSGVSRWHTEWVVRRESVSEHSFNVAMILRAVTPPEHLTYDLVMAGLTHDLGEYEVGDVPGKTKWQLPCAAQDKLAALEENSKAALGHKYPLSDAQKKYLAAADFIDLSLYALMELHLGNRQAVIWLRRISQRAAKHTGFDVRVDALLLQIEEATIAYSEGQEGVLRALTEVGFW